MWLSGPACLLNSMASDGHHVSSKSTLWRSGPHVVCSRPWLSGPCCVAQKRGSLGHLVCWKWWLSGPTCLLKKVALWAISSAVLHDATICFATVQRRHNFWLSSSSAFSNRTARSQMMEDFLKKYDEHRALADVDESLLQIRHPDLDVDQTDEFSQSLTQPAACSEASCALFNEVLQAWMPQSMKQNYGPSRQGAWEFQVDREDLPAGLAEQMDGLREKIDRVFGWAGKRLAQEAKAWSYSGTDREAKPFTYFMSLICPA